MSFKEKIMGGNKIKNVPIILEAKLRLMSQFSIKVYVGNAPPNHRLMMMGHRENTFFLPHPNNVFLFLRALRINPFRQKIKPTCTEVIYVQIMIDYDIGWHVSHRVFSAEVPRIRPIVSKT
jgi:hypothetical protein